MNTHDDTPDDARDEDQVAKLLRASETDGVPPDRDGLARLRPAIDRCFLGGFVQGWVICGKDTSHVFA